MNKSLALSMEGGIKAGTFERGKGFCLRACRQAYEKVGGTKYDALFRGNGTERDATAARAGHRFLAQGLAFPASELKARGGLQPGDMPVKTQVARNRWGDFSGHIGVVCMDLRIGENSSTSIGRVKGALGFRTQDQFGEFDIVIRLPDPKPEVEPVADPQPQQTSIILVTRDGAKRLPTLRPDGQNWAQVRATLAALGLEIEREGEWSDGSPALFVKL